MLDRLQKILAINAADRVSPRLVKDARRLFARVLTLTRMKLISRELNETHLEIACYALQLPLRQLEPTAGKLGQLSLKQRAEQAAELLVGEFEEQADDVTLDRVTRILRELTDRSSTIDEARLLADAVNLDDFGISGLFNSCVTIAVQGHGIDMLLEGAHKRDAYGYWDARLRDGFHFPEVRAIAEKRLIAARKVLAQLADETREDRSP